MMRRKFSRIEVAVRKRPINDREVNRGDRDIITCPNDASSIFVHEPKVRVDMTPFVTSHSFCFDYVFGETATNEEIYESATKQLVDFVFSGGNAAVFAYGQTGSGKTHTMMGRPTDGNPGLYLLAADEIFSMISDSYPTLEVHVSLFEIYGTKLFDLLNDRKQLFAREDAKKVVNVVGLTEHGPLPDVATLMEVTEFGNSVRKTGTTGANDESSRSHAILHLVLRDTVSKRRRGKFSFVDLAGSERGADTANNNRQTRLEGAEINKSLLALKEVFRAMSRCDDKHIPFRGSKLTAVLRDSFIGHSRTLMIANVSPASSGCEHTMNTLRYADRVKELRAPKASSPGLPFEIPTPNLAPPARKNGGLVLPDIIQRRQQVRDRGKDPLSVAVAEGSNPSHSRASSGDQDVLAELSIEENRFEPSFDEESDPEYTLARSRHCDLMNSILDDQDRIISRHKDTIDRTIAITKEEMYILQREENSEESNLELYVNDSLLAVRKKLQALRELESALVDFQNRLEEEENLARSFLHRR